MAPLSDPRIRRTPQNTQFTYNLSKRVHDIKTYPVLSPQGATILIHAHDNGITLVWRGGKRFKPTKKAPPPSSKAKQNGANADVIMLDSDSDEDTPAKANTPAPFVDKPEFEAANEDDPYPETVQTLDLSLGAAAFHIAVPPMTPCAAEDATWAGADVLKHKMVFAVSCVSGDVYLITLPLTPPSPESKARPELRSNLLAASAGSGQWGDTVTILAGQTKHSQGIALSLAKPPSTSTSDRTIAQSGSSPSTPMPRLVIASHNREASGVLRFWDVPLDSATSLGDKSRARPFQTEYLPSPLSSISFNPTNTSQLLAVAPTHAVRIFDFAAPTMLPDDQTPSPFPPKGSWLLSLYQPFTRPTATRKRVLDAAWISHGRAVFTLLADGTWGIWDVEGASPLGSTILGKQSSGIKGAALTAFSVSGHVEGTSPLRGTGGGPRSNGDFVPMTPHTRRDAAASLNAAATPATLASVEGGVAVVPYPGDGSRSGDETVVLWIGDHENVAIIPAISRFWDAQLRKTSGGGGGVGLFGGSTPTKMVRLHDLSTGLLGERCCGVGAAVDFARLKNGDDGLRVEILIQGETRLVVVRESEESPGSKVGGIVPTRRRLFSDKGTKGEPPSAIIVHKRPDQPGKVSFDLSVRKRRGPQRLRSGRESVVPDEDDATHDFTLPIGRPKSGFGFNLDAAADVEEEDVAPRNIEAEMLDIMDIDRALETMEDDSRSGETSRFR